LLIEKLHNCFDPIYHLLLPETAFYFAAHSSLRSYRPKGDVATWSAAIATDGPNDPVAWTKTTIRHVCVEESKWT